MSRCQAASRIGLIATISNIFFIIDKLNDKIILININTNRYKDVYIFINKGKDIIN